MISTANTIASAICDEMYAFPKISITPSRIPPINAPGIEPIPPSQIVKADEPIFLDDMTVEELQNALQVPVIIVQSSGVGLFNRMIEMENEHE